MVERFIEVRLPVEQSFAREIKRFPLSSAREMLMRLGFKLGIAYYPYAEEATGRWEPLENIDMERFAGGSIWLSCSRG